MIWNGAAVTLHRASTAHAAEVLDVLDEAAAWLRRRGVTQWPERFESSWIEGAIDLARPPGRHGHGHAHP
jgi:hypothetical protein